MLNFISHASFPLSVTRPVGVTSFPLNRTFRTAITTTTRRRRNFRVFAAERLYPEPSQPERIENPLDADSTASPPQPSASTGDYLTRLNRNSASSASSTKNPPAAAASAPAGEAVTAAFAPAARAFWRLGWLVWWVQLTLTVISAVILLFSFFFPGVSVRSTASLLGVVLAAAGVVLAFLSLASTYSYTRLSLWLGRQDNPARTPEKAAARIAAALRVGLVLAVLGLVVSLTGLQAIVGTLLARLLSAGIATAPAYVQPGGYAAGQAAAAVVQPIDILVVQASANAMTALLAALVLTIWFRAKAKSWGNVASDKATS